MGTAWLQAPRLYLAWLWLAGQGRAGPYLGLVGAYGLALGVVGRVKALKPWPQQSLC